MDSRGGKQWASVVVLRPAAEVGLWSMLLNLLFSLPLEEKLIRILEKLLPKCKWRCAFEQNGGQPRGGGRRPWTWRFLFKERLVPALGSAVRRQPTTPDPIRSACRELPWTRSRPSWGSWLPMTDPYISVKAQSLWPNAKGSLRTRFPHGTDQGVFQPAMQFDFLFQSHTLPTFSRGIK